MGKNQKEISRRNFLELVAVGAAGAAVSSLNVPSAFSAAAKTVAPKMGPPKRGGTLKAGVGWLIQTPDPQRYQGGWARIHSSFIYEGLTMPISMGERMQLLKKGGSPATDVRPMLADKWEIEKGGRRYVFHLKKGVKFHNGKELDSGDVEWCWKRIQDPVHLAGARLFLTPFLESIETPDKYTIVANLSKPYGAFLMANAWMWTPILPKNCMPHGVIWGVTPTFTPPTPGPPGTGPFKLVKYQQKFEEVLEAFREYRIPGLPYLDRINLKVITEISALSMAVRAGDIDYAIGADPQWAAKVLSGKELYTVQNLEKEGLSILTMGNWPYTIYLNCHPEKGNSPFKDERVRQALDYCLDRAKIVSTIYGRMAAPTGQGYDPHITSWYYDDIPYTQQNIPKAVQLLKEAGYPNGLDVNFHIDPTWAKQDLLAQVVQQMARPAGFRIKILPELGVQYWNRLTIFDYHMLHYQLGMDDPMALPGYYPFLHTDPAPPNYGFSPAVGLKDPEMDKLLDDMAAENNFQKRRQKFKKCVLYAKEKAFWLPYAVEIGYRVWNKKLNNYKPLDYFFPEKALVEAWLET